MDDTTIRDTVAALDRRLARIAMEIAGSPEGAEAVMVSLGKGETTPATRAFLSEGAALLRARLLLAGAIPAKPRRSLRKAA